MRTIFLVIAVASLGACRPALPDGVSCTRTLSAADDQALVDALAKARSGECVLAEAGTYRRPLTVTDGVALVAGVGSRVVVEGVPADQAAITLFGSARLVGIAVHAPAGVGVLIEKGPARLDNVAVDGAGTVALVAWCEEDCRPELLSELHDVELTGSQVGLWVRGARAKLLGGRIANNVHGASFSSGYGVCASHGGSLEMEGTVVEANQELGVLVDGDLGTSATLKQVQVRGNGGRGLWLQGLQGTSAAPKAQLDGCVIEGNRLVGLGAKASRGIAIRGGRIASTAVEQVKTGLGETASVGDGIGLFEGTGAVLVDGVVLELNERSQALVDQAGAGIVVQGGAVTASPGQMGVVVQRSTEAVQASGITTPAPGSELAFSAPVLTLPAR